MTCACRPNENISAPALEVVDENLLSIQEEIKSRMKSGNACHHAVQNLLSSSLLSRKFKIKI